MNLQTIALIALRLMGLNTFINGLIYGVSALVNTPPDSGDSLEVALVYSFASIIAAVFLLAFAPSIASRIIKENAEISFGALSLVDCYTIGFAAVGAYYLALYLPNAVSWIIHLFKSALATPGTEWRQNVELTSLIEVFGWLVAGYFLLLNSRRWAIALVNKITTPPTVPPSPTA